MSNSTEPTNGMLVIARKIIISLMDKMDEMDEMNECPRDTFTKIQDITGVCAIYMRDHYEFELEECEKAMNYFINK